MMKIMWKCVVGFFGVGLAGLASAQAVDGTIIFQEAQVTQPLAVPTIGIMAAVVLVALFLVVARRTFHQNRHTLASFSVLGAALAGALMLASLGVLRANGGININVTDQSLGQPLSFSCPVSGGVGTLKTTFTNTTSGSIEVASISGDNCIFDSLETNPCLAPGDTNCPSVLAVGESCLIVALPPKLPPI